MAREFGKRSYNPEDISFAASGAQPSGLPWAVVQRKIPKNILLQASNNPSTLEELSIELGIALPYMEEEVDILHRATLLEKQGDKYITNFFILDKECRTEVYYALRNTARERSRLLREFMDDRLTDIRALGIAGDHMDDNTIRWWLVLDLIDYFIETVAKGKGENIYYPPKRANGETWGFVGYESGAPSNDIGIGHNGVNGIGNQNEFWAYKYYSLWKQCGEPEFKEVMLMCDCVRNHRRIASFTDVEKESWDQINGRYAHASDDGFVIPDILVLTSETSQKIHQMLCEHKNYEALKQNFANLYDKVEEIFKKYSHQVLHNHIGYNIRMELYSARMMAIRDLLDDNVLKIPENPSHSLLGMNLFLK